MITQVFVNPRRTGSLRTHDEKIGKPRQIYGATRHMHIPQALSCGLTQKSFRHGFQSVMRPARWGTSISTYQRTRRLATTVATTFNGNESAVGQEVESHR